MLKKKAPKTRLLTYFWSYNGHIFPQVHILQYFRRAHNTKVGGSNPSLATIEKTRISSIIPLKWGLFFMAMGFDP